MLKTQKLMLQIPVLLPPDQSVDQIRERLTGEMPDAAIRILYGIGGVLGEVEVVSVETLAEDAAAVAIAATGADLEGFVIEADLQPIQDFIRLHGGDPETVMVIRPTVMNVASPEPVYGAVVVVTRRHPDGGWTAIWGVPGGETHEIPHPHPNEADAATDARRRYEASKDPEAEADEFEDGEHADPFDATIRYAALLIDDENRWRGRWYRGEWSSEGQYTDLLYDTPGQARRAARRLRTTEDES